MQLHPKGFDLSLERIRGLLEKLGNPHLNLPPVIHIAGTNGKGSASAFCRAILEASGFGVHVHTSPHLVNWHERYRLAAKGGGEFVSDDVLADAIERVEAANGGQHITVFEILSAVAFVLFSEHPADVVILEVGLGGRFDATNVIDDPAAALIMPISIDHQAYLGDKVELIAAEKAGIIKEGCPVVIGFQFFDAAREVLTSTADRLNCPVSVYGQDFLAFEEHGRMVFQNEDGLIDLPLPRLPGRHQIANAAAAIETVQMAGFTITEKAAEKALMVVDWPARMQRLTHGALVDLAPPASEIWLDGGHNPGAGIVIAEALGDLEERSTRPLFLITGMINTKDPTGYFEAFAGMARHVFTVPISSSDATIANDTLALAAQKAGLSAEPVHSVANALKLLRDTWPHDEAPPRILIGGSLYLAGEVLAENGTPPL
ncbi:bifunctional folylpolyglutamate synthase/dihydrofolate synthase [Falsochrobactrum shanghaiense]|uniref:tetrahydrofolate synthase n=1 Tax=Falsochrobactrum shanghaiense TaxID=2201899 RepID=A0A316JGN0_9HYPH|nr:folylpolyglutamate synthase/dihydrofolate synthase family protein [Falsochrobactrum shanghaiense]PWL19769.1 bifunctional folylpolyglutamate synthase/dihydrofolate synthase [Falsochrobactrum shanghaiense]